MTPRRAPLALLLSLAIALLAAVPAHAALFEVNALGDHAADGCDPSPGDCTVRDAIAAANAASDSDTIALPAGTFTLSSGALSITGPVAISGPATQPPAATLDPAYSNRVFDVAASAGTVTISHLVIANGQSPDSLGGSGLLQRGGTVTLDHDILTGHSNNLAGGALLQQGGLLNVTDTEVRGSHGSRGGGLFVAAGTAEIERTLWLGNDGSTGGGGAIYNAAGVLDVYDSTFAGNSTNSGLGGAIYASASTTLRNDTFQANVASGHRPGDAYSGGSALYADGTTVSTANVLYGDSGYGDSCAGRLPSDLGGSVDAAATCAAAMSGRSILLGPLAANGGAARSFEPWAGSTGVQAGDNQSCTAADQRSVPRPHDASDPCDAGAVEGASSLAAPPPAIAGETASDVRAGSAEIDATVDRRGLVTTYRVDFGLTAAYGSQTGEYAVPFMPGSGAQDVQAFPGGLQPGTLYHYRVVAQSPGGTTPGADHTFTTAPAPVVTTGAANEVQSTQATVAGTVDPRGSATGYHFEYGPTAAYGSSSPSGDAGADAGAHSYSAQLGGLAPSTTYHYRMVATDQRDGTVVATGEDRTFTTAEGAAVGYLVDGLGDAADASCKATSGFFECTSLRAAVTAANASAGQDLIELEAAGTYVLTRGQLTLTGDTFVFGQDARTTAIQGSGPMLEVAAGVQAILASVTLAGGGILNHGSLEIEYSRVTGGSGIANAGGDLGFFLGLIDHVTGDGIANTGDGTLSIFDATIAFNSGAAIRSDGAGSSLSLNALTVSGNQHGIDLVQAQQADIQGSIVAGNGSGNCPGAKPTDDGYDLESGTDCGFTATGSRQSADPQLGSALVDAGGSTDVLTIPAASAAVNMVAQCLSGTDQRGFQRSDPCDAGAYEYAPAAVITGGPSGPTADASPRFTFDAIDADAFECRLAGPGQTGEFAACTSPTSYALAQGGDYTFEVRAQGSADPPTRRAFTLDSTAPAAPVISTPAEGAVLGSTTVTISGTAEPGTSVAVDAGDQPFAFADTGGDGRWSVVSDRFGDGVTHLVAHATDAAGNRSAGSAVRTFRIETSAPPGPQPQASPAPVAPAVPTPTPAPAPTPVPGKTVVAAPLSGKVLVKLPGGKGFVEVDAAQGIPLGSTVDTRAGVVQITAAGGQVAKFYDGVFKVTQSGGITDLTLVEALAPCGKGAKASAKKPKTRKLWGDGTGSFRTRGQYSAATVRGTNWLVQDSCAGTLTRVKKGVVSVTDTVKHKTVLLKAGKQYLARPRR